MGVSPAEIPIVWAVRSYEDMTAVVGDTVTFDWTGTHNVHTHPTGTCDTAGAVLVSDASPASYTFTEAGTITFSCDVSNGAHCDAGQIVTFEVAAVAGGDGRQR